MKQTRNFIPERLQFAHDYCFNLHDLLANTVVRGEQQGIFNHKIHFKNKMEAKAFAGKPGEALFEWLKDNGHAEDASAIVYKHVCVALLSDFCHFLYTALDCSAKGKLSVTYSVLRKPLKENLFYLEWMLADPDDFLERFNAEIDNPKKRALPLPSALTKERRLQIIRDATAKVRNRGWVSPEFIYELRYDKKCHYGFEQLFQKANHLITTFTAPTEEGNFNFIFSGHPEKESQWEGLYSILPLLLLHAAQVARAVVESFAPKYNPDAHLLYLRASIGFILWAQNSEWDSPATTEAEEMVNSLGLTCLKCGQQLKVDEKGTRLLYENGTVKCSECGYSLLLTTDSSLLFLSHLAQDAVICPECENVMAATEENAARFIENQTLWCGTCEEEIDVSFGQEVNEAAQ